MDSARHVIGCHVTPETRVQNAFDDVASTIHQALGHGGAAFNLFAMYSVGSGVTRSKRLACQCLRKAGQCRLTPVDSRPGSAWFPPLKQ